jgi:hypothetical protein
MTRTPHGKVHGKAIELDEDLGVAEGQEVEVQVKVVQPTEPTTAPMGEGLKKADKVSGTKKDQFRKIIVLEPRQFRPRTLTGGKAAQYRERRRSS